LASGRPGGPAAANRPMRRSRAARLVAVVLGGGALAGAALLLAPRWLTPNEAPTAPEPKVLPDARVPAIDAANREASTDATEDVQDAGADASDGARDGGDAEPEASEPIVEIAIAADAAVIDAEGPIRSLKKYCDDFTRDHVFRPEMAAGPCGSSGGCRPGC